MAQSFRPLDGMTTTSQSPARADFERGIVVDPGGQSRAGLSVTDVNAAIASAQGCLWVDIDIAVPGQADLFKQIKGLHPLSVDDALSRKQRPKVEEYNDYLFIVVLGVRFHEETPDPYDLQTFDLCFFLGNHFLITVHAGPSDAVDDVAERLRKNPELLSRGVDRLAHAIMDGAVDEYFPLLDKIDELIDDLEQRVIVSFDESALQDIFAVKRLTLSLRRHVAPEREVFNILTNRPSKLLSPDSQIYFRDISAHVLRINDSIETFRDLASSVLDTYLTQVANRLGRITKGLSVIATLSLPFVVISGMWGMNFQHIPLYAHPHAFWWMLGAQVGIGLILRFVLRFRNLL